MGVRKFSFDPENDSERLTDAMLSKIDELAQEEGFEIRRVMIVVELEAEPGTPDCISAARLSQDDEPHDLLAMMLSHAQVVAEGLGVKMMVGEMGTRHDEGRQN